MAFTKKQISWALYDWGNSAFSTTVVAGFFPIFFKSFWAHSMSATESTFYLGLANSIASICIVCLSPLIGVLVDKTGQSLKTLTLFMCLGSFSTVLLYWVGQGQWTQAAGLFMIGSIAFACANICYDGLLMDVSTNQDRHMVSTLGYSLGYLGGGLLLALNVLWTLFPSTFGITSAVKAVQFSFVSVGLWWFLFSIPMLLYLKQSATKPSSSWTDLLFNSLYDIFNTIKNIGQYKRIGWFLVAYWLYIDGVYTIIKMAVDYGMSLGFESKSLIIALLLVQFVAFPCALLFGKIASIWSAKTGIFIALVGYTLISILGMGMSTVTHFYFLAAGIGLFQGGIQALSRSFFSQLIPPHKKHEFFGLYNMVGKFSAILGPVLVGTIALISGSHRFSILSLSVFFIVGGYLLKKVR